MDTKLKARMDEAMDHRDVGELRSCLWEVPNFVLEELAKCEEAQKKGDATPCRTALRIHNLNKQLAEIVGGEAYAPFHGEMIRYLADQLNLRNDPEVEIPEFAFKCQATGSLPPSRAWPAPRLLALWKQGSLIKSLGWGKLLLFRLIHLDQLLAQAVAEDREDEEVDLWRAEVVRSCCELRDFTYYCFDEDKEVFTTLDVAWLEEVCARVEGWDFPDHKRLDVLKERVVMLSNASDLPEQIRLEEALERVISQDDKALKHNKRRQQAAAGQLDAGDAFYIVQGLIEVVNLAADTDLLKPQNWCLNARGVDLLAEVQKRIDAVCPCQDVTIAATSSWASIAAQKACSHVPARHSSADCDSSDWSSWCWRTCVGIRGQSRTVKVAATAPAAMELQAAALALVAESSRW